MTGHKRGAAGADLPGRILPLENKKSAFEEHLEYEMKSI